MSWRRIHDATVDDAGTPYFSADLPERDKVVFALGPDFTSPRWLVDTPINSPLLALARARNQLLVHGEFTHQAILLSCADGARVGPPIGGDERQGAACDLRNANSIAIDPQGSLVVLRRDRLRRFSLEGAELPPWPGATPTPPDDSKHFWQLADRPTSFKTSNSFVAFDRAGAMFLFGWEGPCFLAQYDASGKRTQKLELPFRGTYPRGRPWIDASGRVYLFMHIAVDNDADLDAQRELVVVRVSADFSRIERLVEADDDRASLAEQLCVAPDGTVYIAGPDGGLHVFAPDGTPRYSTHRDPNESPPFSRGESANAPVAVRSLRGKVTSAVRAEADDPDLVQTLSYFAIMAAIPVGFYFLGTTQGQDGGAAVGCGLTAGFFLAPAIIGWFARRGLRFFRLGVVGRSICGVLGAIPFALFLLVFVGVDPLGMGYAPPPDHHGSSSSKDAPKAKPKKKPKGK